MVLGNSRHWRIDHCCVSRRRLCDAYAEEEGLSASCLKKPSVYLNTLYYVYTEIALVQITFVLPVYLLTLLLHR